MRLSRLNIEADGKGQNRQSIWKRRDGVLRFANLHVDVYAEQMGAAAENIRIAYKDEGRQTKLAALGPGCNGYVRADTGGVALREGQRQL